MPGTATIPVPQVPGLSPLAVALAWETECRHPVEIRDDAGRVWFRRCMSREAASCPACSRLTVDDWSAIARSGVFDPPVGADHRWYFLTLTAPGFGPVHYVPRGHQERRRCACGRHHTDHDAGLRGSPVHPDTYDYDGQVKWNRDSGRLWDRTHKRLRTLMPGMSYFAVREWQTRGVIHLHVIVRVPAEHAVSPAHILTECRVAQTMSPIDGHQSWWGDQLDCQVRSGDPKDAARTIGYIAKMISYSIKDVAGGRTSASRRYARRLDAAARRMDCGERYHDATDHVKHCNHASHRRYGARGKVVHAGRDWSYIGLTRTRQREARAAWAAGLDDDARAKWASKVREAARTALAVGRAVLKSHADAELDAAVDDDGYWSAPDPPPDDTT